MSSAEEQIYKLIGQNIRKYRMAKGITQEKLSEVIEVSDKLIGHIERFEKNVSLRKLIKISRALDIQLKDLFDF